MKINKKETWESLYKNTELKEVTRRIDYGLLDSERLFSYYPWLNLIVKNKLKLNNVLELGCGTGSYSLVLMTKIAW